MNSNQALADFANALDGAKMTSLADRVDKIAKNVAVIKTSQYVGVQGYWIRNDRCWKNCYRQKRAENKNMPAQKVWTACHSEYLKSLNNNNADWNKYAGEDEGMKKIASVKGNQKILTAESSFFNQKLAERIEQKWPVGVAVFDTIEKGAIRRESQMLSEAAKIAKISHDLKAEGQDKLAKMASGIVSEIVKEAQFRNMLQRGWDKAKGFFTGDQNNAAIQQLNELIGYGQQLQGDLQNAVQSRNPQIKQQYETQMAQFQQNARDFYPTLAKMLQNDPSGNNILQSYNNFLRAGRGQRTQALAPFLQSSSDWINDKQQEMINGPELLTDQQKQQYADEQQAAQAANGQGQSVVGPGSNPGGTMLSTTEYQDQQAQPEEQQAAEAQPQPSIDVNQFIANLKNLIQQNTGNKGLKGRVSTKALNDLIAQLSGGNEQPESEIPTTTLAPANPGYYTGYNAASRNPDTQGRVALGSVLRRIKTY